MVAGVASVKPGRPAGVGGSPTPGLPGPAAGMARSL